MRSPTDATTPGDNSTVVGGTGFLRPMLDLRLITAVEPVDKPVGNDRATGWGSRLYGRLWLRSLTLEARLYRLRLRNSSRLLAGFRSSLLRARRLRTNAFFLASFESPTLLPEVAGGLLAVRVSADVDEHPVRIASGLDEGLVFLLLCFLLLVCQEFSFAVLLPIRLRSSSWYWVLRKWVNLTVTKPHI